MLPLASLIRRNGRRDVKLRPVFGEANSFEVIIAFTSHYTSQDLLFLPLALRRNESQDRGSDHLVDRVAEDAFRTLLPAGNLLVDTHGRDAVS